MLSFHSHKNKFIESNETFKLKDLGDIAPKKFSNTQENNINKSERPDLIKEIKNSGRPYIFLFIQDIVMLYYSVIKRMKDEKNKQRKWPKKFGN